MDSLQCRGGPPTLIYVAVQSRGGRTPAGKRITREKAMRTITLTTVLCAGVWLLGCGEKPPPADTLPEVTLIERSLDDTTMLLRFCLTRLDRVDWTRKVLRAQVVKAGGTPVPVGANVTDPGPEFTIKILVGKPTEGEKVLFLPAWGRSKNGIIEDTVPFDFEGTPDSATVAGSANRKLTQILKTCTGPGRTINFDPKKGVDLVTVGRGDSAYVLKVWVGSAAKPEK